MKKCKAPAVRLKAAAEVIPTINRMNRLMLNKLFLDLCG
jgi:hypothetical protein